MANGLMSEGIDDSVSANLGKPISPPTKSLANDAPLADGAQSTEGGSASAENVVSEVNGASTNGELTSEVQTSEVVASPAEPNADGEKTIEHASVTNGDSTAAADADPVETIPAAEPSAEPTTNHQPKSPITPPQEKAEEDEDAALLRQQDDANKVVPPSGPTPPQSAGALSPGPSTGEADSTAVKDDVPMAETSPEVSAQPDSSTANKHERAEESGEPSAKRARTDDGSSNSTPAVTFAEPDPERQMTPNRQKYSLTILRQLKRSKDCPPFLQPVDPVKLKIPDYFKVVTNPQDLGTIEARLKKGDYETLDAFIDAVQLVWSNCERYNGREAPINQMALRLKEQFERQLRSMPPPEPVGSKDAGRAGKMKKGAKSSQTSTPVSRPRKASSPAVPSIRRESIGVDGRPKREIHAPPPKSLPYQNAPQRRGKNAAQLKFCSAVLKELFHKKHEAYAFPFYVPVDAKALNLHDYHTVIRNPMDLGTMQSKLAAGEYESADDFEYDMRLMFRNCYKYNPPGQPVNTMGKRLESVFNEKWAEKPIQRPGGYGSESEDDSDVDDSSKQTVQMLTKQLEAMKNQIASINSQKKKKKPKRDRFDDDDGGMGPGDYEPSHKSKKGRKGRDALDEIDESPMFPTFEQKTALSTKMGYMTEHQMPVVIQILKRTDPNFDPEDEEVELDVDKVHPKTIRLLWNWIMEDTQPSFMQKKKAAKTKKNRSVLSENEQQRQIEQLEAQLNKFNGNNGNDAYGYNSRYGNIPNDDSSEDDSDASSEEDD